MKDHLEVATGREGVAVLFAFAALLASCDEAPPYDQDLTDFRRSVPQEANGFAALDTGAGGTIWPQDDEVADGRSLRGDSASFDLERAERWIEERGHYLVKLDAMLETKDFQPPPDYDFDSRAPYLLQWRDLAYLLDARSRVHEERGRASEALDDALKLFYFGNRIEWSQGLDLCFLVGIAIQSIGVNRILSIVKSCALEDEDLEWCQLELARLSPNPRCLQDALRAEYVLLSRTMDRLGRRDLSLYGEDAEKPWVQVLCEQPLLLPNETKRLCAGEIRDLIRSVEKLSKERRPSDAEKKYRYVRGHLDWIWNAHGKCILLSVLPVLEKTLPETDKLRGACSMTRVLLAVRRYQLASGGLPASLDDLVPDYLEEIPRDPFHGNPLRYSREQKIIYSLGRDGVDAGGSRKQDDGDALSDLDEPTLRIRS